MSGSDKSFFKRINKRWPWLKILVPVVVLIMIAVVAIWPTEKEEGKIAVLAPMRMHVKVPERPLRVLEGKKLAALTFDDGPSAATTPRLLDILYEKNVPATFFELGTAASANPEIVKRVVNEGHELASHTMSHQNLATLSGGGVRSETDGAAAVFESIIGYRPKLVRPPYGSINDTVRANIGAPMILWSVDTLDWKYKNTASILGYTMSEVYDGAIILMHDIHPTSVEAVPTVIDTLRADGYEFVTVSELANLRGVALVGGAAYGSFRP